MPQILMPFTVHLDHTLRVTPMNTMFAKGDSAAHRFELTILRAGVQEDLTGCTVMCKFYRMADSTVVSVPGSVEDGKAVAVLKKACYDYIGRFALTISIKKGEEETTVFFGDGYMHGQNADTSISGEYIIYDINTLLEKIAEIDAATQAANTATSNANTATANANTATGKANTAASAANTAAANANTAKDTANAAAAKIDNMTVSATPVSTGTATAALSTVDGHYHLALGLPKGDTGATPRISVQVQTGAAGSEASVSVSGTAEDPVIHLTIPRGDTGAIENLTINGKPVESGTITLTAADVGAATAEEVSALKSDKLDKTATAADSSKLGGKAPEYYLQPRNLLDNSDFRNPVNQRGQTNYTLSAWGGYCIDRWRVGSVSTTLMVNYNDCTLSGEIYQTIDRNSNGKNLNGKTVTIAAKVNGSVTCKSGNIAMAGEWAEFAAFPIQGGRVYIYADSNNNLHFGMVTDGTVTIEWAAIYEGAYTADTLPPYVPKGYAAELAECRRYYSDLGRRDDVVSAAWATYSGTVTLPTVMATASPTVIVKDMNGNIDKASVVSGNGEGTSIAIGYSRTNKSVDVYPAGTGVAGQIIRYTLALSSDL